MPSSFSCSSIPMVYIRYGPKLPKFLTFQTNEEMDHQSAARGKTNKQGVINRWRMKQQMRVVIRIEGGPGHCWRVTVEWMCPTGMKVVEGSRGDSGASKNECNSARHCMLRGRGTSWRDRDYLGIGGMKVECIKTAHV